MIKKLLFIGGGHAHLNSLSNLSAFKDRSVEITVVNRSPYHYYSGMGPGLLSGYYTADEVRFNVKRIVQSSGSEFIEAEAIKINAEEKKVLLSNNDEVEYDVVSFNTGSETVPFPMSGKAENVFNVKPIENLIAVREKILNTQEKMRVAVIGGGPTGVEIAANLRELAMKACRDADIFLISASRILENHPFSLYRVVIRYLQQRNIVLYENMAVSKIERDRVVLHDGKHVSCNMVINAAGIRPSRIFINTGIATSDDGGIVVNKYLQSVSHPDIFAGGDCVSFEPSPLDRVGVYAVKEGGMLFRNLISFIKGAGMTPFDPQKKYLSILNIGRKTGVMRWKKIILSGCFPFYFKYYLDRAFMKKYQK